MSLFNRRKEGKPSESRTLKILWDSATKKATVHYRRGKVRHKKVFPAESLADAEDVVAKLWEERE